MENIVLIGMPGCGKSTIGKLLAEKMDLPFLDADTEIVRKTGISIPEIFEKYGEDGFRNIETQVLSELSQASAQVIATGGGCVTRQENYPLLHQNGTIYWIERDLNSLSTDGRPLSQAGKLEKMYSVRKPMYEAFADVTISNNGCVEETVASILKGRQI